MSNLYPNGWLINISEIQPGNSAVVSGNKLAFYGIHSVGISLLTVSLISSITVIISILFRSKREKWDFSERFPLYVGIADGLFALSNLFADHVVLVITQTFPDKRMDTALSINVWFFVGYQQLMQGGLAAYTYLKIVRRVPIDLGKGEWKLHAFAVTTLVISIGIFWPLGAFGCSGYWFLANLNTTSGTVLAFFICTSVTLHALLTIFGYRAINAVVQRQKRVVSTIKFNHDTNCGGGNYHSTATSCLNTFVYISSCIYGPMAIACWGFLIQSIGFGFIEPCTALFIVCAANAGGFANTLGYFHNQRIKRMRRQAVTLSKVISPSTCSTKEV